MQKAATLSVILREITGLNGSGQGDVFFDRIGTMWYVFHFHNLPERVSPQRTAIIRLIKKNGSRGFPHCETDKKSLRILWGAA